MKIVHFSDIHAWAGLSRREMILDKRLLGVFNHVLRRGSSHHWDRVSRGVEMMLAEKPDLIINTGDVSTLSDPLEFEMAQKVLEPLTQSGIPVYYVPGNHDYYVRQPLCYDALIACFKKLNSGRELSELPMARRHKKLNLLLINQACPAPLLGSFGRLDEKTASWIEADVTRDDNVNILVNHFPLLNQRGEALSRRRSCHNNEALMKAFMEKKIQLALCGHIHYPFARQQADGEAVEICAGSLTYTGSFNLMTVDPESRQLTQQFHFVDEKEGPVNNFKLPEKAKS